MYFGFILRYDLLSHPLVQHGTSYLVAATEIASARRYVCSRHEGKRAGCFSVARAELRILQMSPIVHAASQVASIPLTDVDINVNISLASLAFMQRKAGCFEKGGCM